MDCVLFRFIYINIETSTIDMEYKKIKFGTYTNSYWHKLKGLKSVKGLLKEIKELDWEDYNLYLVGSILSNVETSDVDLIITGPLVPAKIDYLLESIVEIGFEHQIFCDVKFSVTGELFDPTCDIDKTIRYANYRGEMTIDGHPYHFAKRLHGLYLSDQHYPMAKSLNAMLEGRKYKSPKKVI